MSVYLFLLIWIGKSRQFKIHNRKYVLQKYWTILFKMTQGTDANTY